MNCYDQRVTAIRRVSKTRSLGLGFYSAFRKCRVTGLLREDRSLADPGSASPERFGPMDHTSALIASQYYVSRVRLFAGANRK